MLFQLPQFFEDSEEGVVTFDLSFLRRVGDANLVAGTSATLEFATDVGSAGYIVEQGNNTGFQWGPGRSALRLARERQLAVELAAEIVRGNPSLTLYIIQYDSKGARLRQATLRHARERFQGALTLARDVASYTVAIRLAGRGAHATRLATRFFENGCIGKESPAGVGKCRAERHEGRRAASGKEPLSTQAA
ncbi:MAG: hypothetical protein ABSA49_03375 [Rhizomicrobium sp.]